MLQIRHILDCPVPALWTRKGDQMGVRFRYTRSSQMPRTTLLPKLHSPKSASSGTIQEFTQTPLSAGQLRRDHCACFRTEVFVEESVLPGDVLPRSHAVLHGLYVEPCHPGIALFRGQHAPETVVEVTVTIPLHRLPVPQKDPGLRFHP